MDITSLLDGMYWGVILSAILFGIIIVQAWIYFNNNNDKWYIRFFVTVVILLDITVTSLSCQALRYYLMMNFGNHVALLSMTKTFIVDTVIGNVMVYLGMLFLISRIYLLDKSNLWPPVIIFMFATSSCILINSKVADDWKDPRLVDFSATNRKLQVAVGLGLAAAADMSLTAVFVRKLSGANTYSRSLQTVLQKLIAWAVTRCILVTACQIALVVTYTIWAENSYWMPFALFNPKLHLITIMAMLNSRTPRALNAESEMATVSLTFTSNFDNELRRVVRSVGDVSRNTGSRSIDLASVPGVQDCVVDNHPGCKRISLGNAGTLLMSHEKALSDTEALALTRSEINTREASIV